MAVLLLVPAALALAQGFSAADLAGSWELVQLATPKAGGNASSIRAYRGDLSLDAAGAVLAGSTLTDDQSRSFTLSGNVSVTGTGLVGGTLVLADVSGPAGTITLREGRMLLDRHTIVGAGAVLGQVGLFALVKHESGQSFGLADLGGAARLDWVYSELTPSNALAAGQPVWAAGSVTFHGADGSAEADVVLADGSVKIRRSDGAGSFGAAGVGADGAITGTNAQLDGQLATDAAGTAGGRDLIFAITNGTDVGFPGMAALSRVGDGGFAAADLFGAWRIYLHRVSTTAGTSTTQVGRAVFSAAGAMTSGTLVDASAPPVMTILGGGGLAIESTNGSVTGVLTAGPTTRYTIRGALREAKDLIAGVVTANVSGQGSHGLVTLVREPSFLDVAQDTYTVTEGNSVTVTVTRTGDVTGPAAVTWTATGPDGVLVPPVTGTVAFPAGAATRMFAVKTAGNTAVDGDRSVSLVLSNPSGAMLGSRPSATLTVLEDDKAGRVRLSAGSFAVAETAKSLTVTIQRSQGAAGGVVVQFALTPGTALPDRDYSLPANSSVTFNTGETVKTVTIPILDNTVVDGPRTFTFALTSISGGGTLDTPSSATVTIGDNDQGGTVQFTAAAYTISELSGANTSATITVSRMGGGAGGVLVDFATADGTARAGRQYLSAAGTLTFNAGNTSMTFTVPVLSDAGVAGDSTVLLSLSNVRSSSGAGPGAGTSLPVLGMLKSAALTIKDAQAGIQFSAAAYAVSETAGSATVGVVRSGPLNGTATVRYSTTDGSARAGVDYVSTSGVLTFGPNIPAQSFPVRIIPDRTARGARSVLLLLSGANSSAPPIALAQRSSAILTINDTDLGGTVQLGTAAISVKESAGEVVIPVTRTGGTAGGVSVVFTTSDLPCSVPPCPGLAQAARDYDPFSGVLTFGPGEITKNIRVPITADARVEGNETFLVTLLGVQGGATLGTPSQAVVTILDDDEAGIVQFSSATYTAIRPPKGMAANVSITLSRAGTNLAAGASTTVFTSSTTGTTGVDFLQLVQTVVFDANQRSLTVPLTILGEPASTPPGTPPAGDHTVTLLLLTAGGGATFGAQRTALVTIKDFNRSVQFSASRYMVNEGETSTITIVRAGPTTGTITVPFSTGNASAVSGLDFVPKATTLTFGPGVTSQTVTVSTLKRPGFIRDPGVLPGFGDRALTLSLGTPSAGAGIAAGGGNATLFIRDVDRAGSFLFLPNTYSVVEGGSVTLTLGRALGSAGAVNVPWHLSGAAPGTVTPASGNFSFTAGMTSKTLTLAIAGNTILEGNRSFSVVLDTPIALGALDVEPPSLGFFPTATVNVLDNETGGTIQFASAAQAVAENVPGGAVSLPLIRAGGLSLAGGVTVGYTITGDTGAIASPLSGTLTFAAGQTAAAIPVTLVPPNAVAQTDRVLVVTLTNASAGTFMGTTAPVLGPRVSTTLTIVDTSAHVQFSAPAYAVLEGDTATITVTRSGPATAPPVVVGFTTADGSGVAGTDYTTASGTLTITGAAGKATFQVPTKDDGLLAGNRTVMLTLMGASGGTLGTPSQAVLTLQERQSGGTVQFASATTSVVEGSTVRITVTRGGANLPGVSVGWSATGGSATPGSDFTPASGILTFGPGVTNQTFDIDAIDDGVPEGTETIVLSLDPPSGASLGTPSSMTVFVLDRQQSIAFAGSAVAVSETAPSVTATIVRSGVPDVSASVRVQTVDGSAIAGQDYGTRSDIVTFAPGETMKPFVVPILSQNASRRDGNRRLSLVLSEVTGAVLGTPNASTVTILDFRPDLIIASVASPFAAVTGKAASTPSTVSNIGPVEAPPFSIGLYMVRSADFDPANPRAGALVGSQEVGRLGAGASVAFPTQISLDDTFPAGQYFLTAVANFDNRFVESDTSNNARSSFPTPITVSKGLSFKSATATFTQASLSVPGAFAPAASCDLTGTTNLTGTFTISDQQGSTATGQANLTGALGGVPVRYLLDFTLVIALDGTVTGTFDNVNFTSLTPPPLTGTGTGTFTGTFDGSKLDTVVTGQFTTSTAGLCTLSGALTAVSQPSYQLRFASVINVGTIGFDPTPMLLPFPIGVSGYVPAFKVFFDDEFPPASSVLFTGPPGSGINSVPADESTSSVSEFDIGARYILRPRTGSAPGGTWTVLYKGQPRRFTVPPFNGNSSFVLIYPTITAESGFLTRIDWTYRDPVTGAELPGPPASVAGVQVRVLLNTTEFTVQSGRLDPSTTSFVIEEEPDLSEIVGLRFQYGDLAGNEYELNYGNAFSVSVETRLENCYGAGTTGACAATGAQARVLQTTVNVPSGFVNHSPDACAVVIFGEDTFPDPGPYIDGGCLTYTGTGPVPNGVGLVDVFTDRLDLSDFPSQTGQSFLITIDRLDIVVEDEPEDVFAFSQPVNADANPATDVIFIPNPATPALKPPGFTLTDARLGQRQTISWTPPAFTPVDISLDASVALSDGRFCSSQDVTITGTQTAFTLPATCFGRTAASAEPRIERASACVMYRGDAGQVSQACWTWR